MLSCRCKLYKSRDIAALSSRHGSDLCFARCRYLSVGLRILHASQTPNSILSHVLQRHFSLRVRNLLQSTLRILEYLLNLPRFLLRILLQLSAHTITLQARLVSQHPADLCGTNTEEQEVHRSEKQVPGLDDEAPACPDQASSHQSCVLGEGELVGWAGEICGAC